MRQSKRCLEIKSLLVDKLSQEGAFWSYPKGSMTPLNIDDDNLIAWTMRYLDLEEIRLLFTIYPKIKIKNAWKRLLVPEGDYLYTLNRFFAWYYFDAKNPDIYLKSIQTRQLKSLIE